MAFIHTAQVQPKLISLLLGRGSAICHVNNAVKTRVCNCRPISMQTNWQTGSSPDKKCRFLINKQHPQFEAHNFVRYQSCLKSPVLYSCIGADSIRAFSTNPPSDMGKNSHHAIFKSKGTAPATSTSILLMCLV